MPSDAVLAAFATDEELMTREDASRLVRRLWSLLGAYHRKIYFSLLLIAIWTACLLAGPALVKRGIDAGLTRNDATALYVSAGVYLCVAVAGLFFGRAAIWSVSKVGEPFLRDLRNKVFRHLMSLDLGFFEREQTGRLVARLTSDVDAMQDLVQIGLAQFAQNVFLFVGAVVVILVMSWQLALCTLVVVPPVVFASRSPSPTVIDTSWRTSGPLP